MSSVSLFGGLEKYRGEFSQPSSGVNGVECRRSNSAKLWFQEENTYLNVNSVRLAQGLEEEKQVS